MRTSCVPEKLFYSNKVLRYILASNENVTKDIFRESELDPLSSSDYSALFSNELLSEIFRAPEKIIYYDKNKTAYKVRKEEDGYFGYRLNGEGESRIKFQKSETKFLRFNRDKFIELLKTKNDLSGRSSGLTERIHFVGLHKKGKGDVGVILGLFPSDAICEKELLSLPSRFTGVKKFLVLCPQYSSEVELNTKLEGKGIFCYQFDSILGNDFKIDFSCIKSEDTIIGNFVIPDLTATEQRKYAKNYPRKDIIEFTNRETGFRSYIVLINGQEVPVQYGHFALLLFFAIALKQEKNLGRVTKEDVDREGLINTMSHFHRLISELKKILKPIEDNKVDLIENLKGQSKYRLTTMPSRIKTPHSKWLTQKYKLIKTEVIKEREKRLKKKSNGVIAQ